MNTGRAIVFAVLLAIAVGSVPAAVLAEDDKAPDASAAMVNLELKDTPLKTAIDTLFDGRNLKYYIQPGVSGKIVELKLKGVTFEQALKALTEAADLTCKVEDGTYIIGLAKVKSESTSSSAAATAEPSPEANAVSGTPDTATLPSGSSFSTEQPAASTSATAGQPSSQVTINNQGSAPVFYGQPDYPPPYGYGYPPVYNVGGLRVVGRGYEPVVIAGGPPSVMGYGPRVPPPAGWVGPDVMRFLRYEYSLRSGPYWVQPQPWY